jgi:hypothetical protein
MRDFRAADMPPYIVSRIGLAFCEKPTTGVSIKRSPQKL